MPDTGTRERGGSSRNAKQPGKGKNRIVSFFFFKYNKIR